MFNAILESGIYSEIWTKGTIVLIFKKGDPNDVCNFRGITFVSCFSKSFTGILNNRIKAVIEDHD